MSTSAYADGNWQKNARHLHFDYIAAGAGETGQSHHHIQAMMKHTLAHRLWDDS
jgi:hypothetical protein